MRHTFRWLSDQALDVAEADVLAELPAMAAWLAPMGDRFAHELERELPSLEALGSFAR